MAASLKTDAQPWTIQEQIIEDPVTGLAFQFERLPNGMFQFRIFGTQYPCREFYFSTDGIEVGQGVVLSGLCRPAWLTNTAQPDD